MRSFLFSILATAFTTTAQAQTDLQLTCVAAQKVHTLMIVNQSADGTLTVQFHFNGQAVTGTLPLRSINLPNEPQYVFTRKGTLPEFVNLGPGALDPKNRNRKTHAFVGEKLEDFYNCIRH